MKTWINVLAATSLVLTADALSSSSSSLALNASPEVMRALSGYNYLKFDHCFELDVQVPKTVYDNSGENGQTEESIEYTEKTLPYVGYRLCSDCSLRTCSDVAYLAPLGNVIGNLVSLTKSHCSSCYSSCGDHDQGSWDQECKTCHNDCAAMYANDGTNYDDTDETQRLFCGAAYKDQDGFQYYSKATCGHGGHVLIGLFSDNACTEEVYSWYWKQFDYDTFNAMESLCMNCAQGECDSEESASFQCLNGENMNEQLVDEMNVCKAYQIEDDKLARMQSVQRAAGVIIQIIFFFMGLGIAAVLVKSGYKQYLKYKKDREEEKMPSHDDDKRGNGKYASMT